MQRVMRDTAIRLMQGGQVPSVSDVAEAAAVSRATAYRYFPSQASIIHAAVDDALGPILDWRSDSRDAERRISELLAFAYPRMFSHEATHRAALRLALEQWARRHAGTLGNESRIVRGHRKTLLGSAMRPIKAKIGKQGFDKLIQSLSLLFGIEAIVVLRDIWGLDDEDAEKVLNWAAHALVRAAREEAAASRVNSSARRLRNKPAARRSKKGKPGNSKKKAAALQPALHL
jgi:AcrR family transcriptional regulator